MSNRVRYLRIKWLRHRLLFLVIAVSLTPCIATAGIVGFVIAQSPLDAASQLGDKNLAYWFISLAAVAIASCTWFLRLLITQLENQRTANSTLNAQLIDWMQKDHSDMRVIIGRTNEMLDRVMRRLEPE